MLFGMEKLEWFATWRCEMFEDMFIRFDRIHERDGWTHRFQCHDIIQRQITKKHLQWPTKRTSYMVYQTAPFSMTLNDPSPNFKVTLLFNAE